VKNREQKGDETDCKTPVVGAKKTLITRRDIKGESNLVDALITHSVVMQKIKPHFDVSRRTLP
jgi:hypothetical protein